MMSQCDLKYGAETFPTIADCLALACVSASGVLLSEPLWLVMCETFKDNKTH